jgi:hypothetical protein
MKIQIEKTKKYIFINLLKKHLTPPLSGGIISLAPDTYMKERTRYESVRNVLEQLKSGKEINSNRFNLSIQ